MFNIQNNVRQYRRYEYVCRKCKRTYLKYPFEVINDSYSHQFNGETIICDKCLLKENEGDKKKITSYKCDLCNIFKKKEGILIKEQELILCKSCSIKHDLTEIIDILKIDTENYYYLAKKIMLATRDIEKVKIKCKCCKEEKSVARLNSGFICSKCRNKK